VAAARDGGAAGRSALTRSTTQVVQPPAPGSTPASTSIEMSSTRIAVDCDVERRLRQDRKIDTGH
jgi:hypothetical protein